MKKLFKKILKYATSKKLLWIVNIIFVSCILAMGYLFIKGYEIQQLEFIFSWVAKGWMFELFLYSGKATIEKTKLVNTIVDKGLKNITKSMGIEIDLSDSNNSILEEVADDMNTKNG
jgi:hypothetical protein